MSVAKYYEKGDLWFNYKNAVATVEQLEFLADLTGEPIDDILDAGLSQREVADRLFAHDGLIPAHVLEARRRAKAAARRAPACRWCDLYGLRCEGRITRHHYVPRWLMLQLENYEAYAPRRICAIPICLSRHRDLHLRDDSPKSIVACLNQRERAFAQRMIDELQEQHPKVYDLIASGDEYTYEGTLFSDYLSGAFRRQVRQDVADESLLSSIAI